MKIQMTHQWQIYKIWHNYDRFMTFIWQIYDRYVRMIDLWQLYDSFLTDLWHFYANDRFMIVLWHIYMTVLWKLMPFCNPIFLERNVVLVLQYLCWNQVKIKMRMSAEAYSPLSALTCFMNPLPPPERGRTLWMDP